MGQRAKPNHDEISCLALLQCGRYWMGDDGLPEAGLQEVELGLEGVHQLARLLLRNSDTSSLGLRNPGELNRGAAGANGQGREENSSFVEDDSLSRRP